MYLSKLTLNVRNRQVRSEVASPYEMHRTLAKAFPFSEDNRILFRIEVSKNMGISSGLTVLVQSSSIEPKWEDLTISSDYFLTEPQTKKVNLKPVSPGIYKFKLIANPTVKRNGKRYGLYKEEDQIEWFKRKAKLHGFEPLFINCSGFTIGSKAKTAKMIGESHKFNIYHFGVSYEGVLKITNPDKMHGALISGIGSAKAFGFGLLTIARVD